MYHSALNFAAGFFGIPFEHQYHQSVHLFLLPRKSEAEDSSPDLYLLRNRDSIALFHHRKHARITKRQWARLESRHRKNGRRFI
jgi:hypothetical protein